MRKAIVVGGGIGGLSTAVGLHKAGWQVTVAERAARFRPSGSGITLWPNALRGLAELGVAERLGPGLTAATAELRDSRGRLILPFDGTAFEDRFGRFLAGVHRATLVEALRAGLPDSCLRPGTEVVSADRDGRVSFRDGSSDRADVVVGADGIHSRLRACLWPGHAATRYAGSTAFRGVAPAAADAPVGIVWEPGVEFGVVPLPAGRRYWYVALVAPPGRTHDDPRRYLLERFAGWPAALRGLIAATPSEAVLHHDIQVLARPLRNYVSGRVALVGDAAHAMTPFLGQGGCQAIEDGVALAAALAEGDETGIDDALDSYDRSRRPRAQSIVAASEQMGRLGHRRRNRLVVAARRLVLAHTPTSVSLRRMARTADWQPPSIRPQAGTPSETRDR